VAGTTALLLHWLAFWGAQNERLLTANC